MRNRTADSEFPSSTGWTAMPGMPIAQHWHTPGDVLSCRDEVRRDHRVSGRQWPAMRTRLPTMPHDTASRTLARLRIGPDADHGAWSIRRGPPAHVAAVRLGNPGTLVIMLP